MPSIALRVEREPVQHGVGRARGPRGRQIFFVGGQDLVRAREHGVGGRMQGASSWSAVLSVASVAGGHPGPARRIVHLLAQVGHRRCLQTHYPSVSDLSAGLDGCQPAPGGLALHGYGGAGLRSGQCQRRSHVHRRCPAAARPDRARLFAVVGPRRQGWQPGGGRRPRRRLGAARRRARHRLRRRATARPPARQRRRAGRRGHACPGPAARRRSSSTPRRRTPSWSRRAPTRT